MAIAQAHPFPIAGQFLLSTSRQQHDTSAPPRRPDYFALDAWIPLDHSRSDGTRPPAAEGNLRPLCPRFLSRPPMRGAAWNRGPCNRVEDANRYLTRSLWATNQSRVRHDRPKGPWQLHKRTLFPITSQFLLCSDGVVNQSYGRSSLLRGVLTTTLQYVLCVFTRTIPPHHVSVWG